MKKKSLWMALSLGILGSLLGGFVVYSVFFPQPSDNYEPKTFEINGQDVNNFTYLLQYDIYTSRDAAVSDLAAQKYDLIIMDAFYDETWWSPGEIDQITSSDQEKIALCYISIGEAESYRPYWNASWDIDEDGIPDTNAPNWLDIENPDWEGNYKVKYWLDDWQALLFGTPEAYIDQIMAQHFDGIYLDIIDAFEYYEERGISQAGQWMVDFVGNLSNYTKNIDPSFLIVPQNGEHLAARFPEYLTYLDGIGREDLLFNGNVKNYESDRVDPELDLQLFLDAGKFVLEVEYPTWSGPINACYKYAVQQGFLCYIGPRDLDEILVHSDYLPD
jgi:cysteinyl-tRNA synthetase